jgi:hypothetical protein
MSAPNKYTTNYSLQVPVSNECGHLNSQARHYTLPLRTFQQVEALTRKQLLCDILQAQIMEPFSLHISAGASPSHEQALVQRPASTNNEALPARAGRGVSVYLA